MSFGYREEHEELRTTVRRFLAARSAETEVRRLMETALGFDEDVWQVCAQQLGLQGLAVPERFGGSGFGMVELQIVFEEMGRVLLCAPFLSTIGIAAQIIVELDDDSVCSELLPGMVDGSLRISLAETDAPDRPTRATLDGSAWTLDGRKRYVLDGLGAHRLLVTAETADGPGLFLVDDVAAVGRSAMTTLDQTRKQAEIFCEDVPARLLGAPGDGPRIVAAAMSRARLLLAAEGAGVCARMVEMSVDYATVRHQFGRPIGSFQAVKHLCTQMLIDTELATSTARAAGHAFDDGADDAVLMSHVAASAVSDALDSVAAELVEVHGGIGFTWEHPAHLYYKRAVSSARLWGTSTQHRAEIFELVRP